MQWYKCHLTARANLTNDKQSQGHTVSDKPILLVAEECFALRRHTAFCKHELSNLDVGCWRVDIDHSGKSESQTVNEYY